MQTGLFVKGGNEAMCLARSPKQSVAPLSVLVCLLNCSLVLCQEASPKSPGKPKSAASIVVDAQDLSRESKLALDKLLADGIARAVNKRWQELGITDQIELKFFADLNRLVRMKDAKTVTTVCLIKPGSDVSRVRHVTFKEGERVAMKYTCITARVTDAIAIVNSIDSDGKELSVQGTVLRYTADGVWKRDELDDK